ncbi:glycosyl transferase, group 1 family protein, putative [Heliomicrobium modesticaldum Ice1]|uniref:Glycosyl transferase, group 1 family protein, putative n=1 Tax=Heliobacterium modesticaldum (strain ATCC 51547 / Ice1) TaxID=498761 RepID=B0THJ6_HELMI|nr:glycosyltransferase family 4 protein [Heliomicrobium modesticaldum]ABZ83434.1 glycosyl transferase, group 1 family protein, putative [Heliomicrobium modesticaldum Ice1]
MVSEKAKTVLFVYGMVGRGGDAIQTLAFIQTLQDIGYRVKTVGPVPLSPYKFEGKESKWRNYARRSPKLIRELLYIAFQLLVFVRAAAAVLQVRPQHIFERVGNYTFVGTALSWLFKVPLIVYMDLPIQHEKKYGLVGQTPYLEKLSTAMLGRRSTRIIVNTEFSKKYYVNMRVQDSKIMVVPNGINADCFRRLSKTPVDDFLKVVYVGSFVAWHNLPLLLQAMKRLSDENSPLLDRVRIQLVGEGHGKNEIMALSEQLGLKKWVYFHGALANDHIGCLLSEAHIGILPGTLETGSPMKLVEYAAAGCVVLSPDLVNCRSFFTGEDAVAYFKPDDVDDMVRALTAVVDNYPDFAQRAREMQARILERYNWERLVRQMLCGIVDRLEDCA